MSTEVDDYEDDDVGRGWRPDLNFKVKIVSCSFRVR